FVEEMKNKAREYQNSLVLPEGTEERTVVAAAKIVAEKLAKKVTLLGKKEDVEKVASSKGVSLEGIDIINPETSEWLDDFGKEYYELRKDKINKKTGQPEVTPESAREYILKDPLSFGAMMVRLGKADSMVSGALSATADLLRAGLKIIKTAPGTSTASSCFVMDTHDKKWGKDGYLIFADCAVNPTPTSEQLADIAMDSAKSCRDLLGAEPAVAMLSFSSKGSGGKLPDVLKVQEAVKIVKEKAPDLLLDGELQADASLIPEVTAKKAPGSPITGKVNTLIFPSLEAGNIGYKLVQRFAGADAYGPILQGFAKPISDLSRGCTSDEIVVTSAITLVQAGPNKN
ncbi:MAG: phosphate acetyltransferase, partial [Treponema sp.]|nr:phosphate acetyltransferase [Treponema sp.]